MSPRAFLLIMLLITEIGMLLMAALFLSGRRGLGWLDYLAWALVALAAAGDWAFAGDRFSTGRAAQCAGQGGGAFTRRPSPPPAGG